MSIATEIYTQYKNDVVKMSEGSLTKVDYYIELCGQKAIDHFHGHNVYTTKNGDQFDYEYDLFVFEDRSILNLTYGVSSVEGCFDQCNVVDFNDDEWEHNGSFE